MNPIARQIKVAFDLILILHILIIIGITPKSHYRPNEALLLRGIYPAPSR